MRRERWIAAVMIAGAVWMGVMAGCGQKQGGGETSTTTSTTETTTATSGGTDSMAAGEVSMALGEQIVKERCILCHGEDGKGDGPGGAALNPKPRNWTEDTYMGTRTDEQLYDVIYNGKGSMPAWGKTGILKENEIRSAILKVRTFDPKYKAAAKG
ncbi:MAG: c-type cytochrome [Candidatus Eisenbacteria bacterium]